MRSLVICGHREVEASDDVIDKISRSLDRVDRLITGMAVGVDLLAAKIAMEKNMPILAFVPYANQAEKFDAENKRLHSEVLAYAKTEKILVSEKYHKGVFFSRNRRMVERASIVMAIMWDMKSGTGNTVSTARELGVECHIYNPRTKEWT